MHNLLLCLLWAFNVAIWRNTYHTRLDTNKMLAELGKPPENVTFSKWAMSICAALSGFYLFKFVLFLCLPA